MWLPKNCKNQKKKTDRKEKTKEVKKKKQRDKGENERWKGQDKEKIKKGENERENLSKSRDWYSFLFLCRYQILAINLTVMKISAYELIGVWNAEFKCIPGHIGYKTRTGDKSP